MYLCIFLRIKCSVKQKCKYNKKIHEKNNLCETGYKKFPKKILGEKYISRQPPLVAVVIIEQQRRKSCELGKKIFFYF